MILDSSMDCYCPVVVVVVAAAASSAAAAAWWLLFGSLFLVVVVLWLCFGGGINYNERSTLLPWPGARGS